MNKPGFIAAGLFLGVAVVTALGELRSGIVIEQMPCRKTEDFSYMLYLPTDYTPAREEEWPVLFVMGPDGGTVEGIRRFIIGAEMNNWIIAMSIQAGDEFDRPKAAVAAMVTDVVERFPIDETRCYAGGMGSGARLAFWLANRQPEMIVGIIPCGGGDTGNRYDSHALAYGLCGGYCFSRWDMTITFQEHIRKRGRLRFFEGGHVWADENLMFDAMTWLNGQYLNKQGTPEEVSRFSDKLFIKLVDRYEQDRYFVYENSIVLAEVKQAPHAEQARAIADKLEADPEIQLYIEALEEMDEFAEKYFNTEASDYRDNRLTQRQHEEAKALLKRYGKTPLAPVIKDFGKPSKKF